MKHSTIDRIKYWWATSDYVGTIGGIIFTLALCGAIGFVIVAGTNYKPIHTVVLDGHKFVVSDKGHTLHHPDCNCGKETGK
jgi:hypothetical protein